MAKFPNHTWQDVQIPMADDHHLQHHQFPFNISTSTTTTTTLTTLWAPKFPLQPQVQHVSNFNSSSTILNLNPNDDDNEEEDEVEEELGAMKEMMYKIAVMQPVDIDPATIRKPKRRNVRISDDPQSVAARHRREKISEKIRILQRLVPGGTKMDTASMLEEAIRYVKFLKRQIRLLQQSTNSSSSTNHNHNSQELADFPLINIANAATSHNETTSSGLFTHRVITD